MEFYNTCTNEEDSSKRDCLRKIDRINVQALREEEVRGYHPHFQVWGTIVGLTTDCGVRTLCHKERKTLCLLSLLIKKTQTLCRYYRAKGQVNLRPDGVYLGSIMS